MLLTPLGCETYVVCVAFDWIRFTNNVPSHTPRIKKSSCFLKPLKPLLLKLCLSQHRTLKNSCSRPADKSTLRPIFPSYANEARPVRWPPIASCRCGVYGLWSTQKTRSHIGFQPTNKKNGHNVLTRTRKKNMSTRKGVRLRYTLSWLTPWIYCVRSCWWSPLGSAIVHMFAYLHLPYGNVFFQLSLFL